MEGDKINIKSVIKGKNIPLTILMIIACSLLTGDTRIILPSLLFVGIIGAMNKDYTMNETLLSTFIAFIIGSLIAIIFSLVSVYYDEGALYAISIIHYSWIYVIYYTFIGCVGGALGYHVKDEMLKGEIINGF